MIARRLATGTGLAVTAGTVLTAFGLVTPAVAEIDCASGVTIDADESDLRDAITAGEDIICINPGTIDLSSAGDDGTAGPIEIDGQDLSLYAPGVIFDGGNESETAIDFYSATGHDLTIEGGVFQDFNGLNAARPAGVVNLLSSGLLTVIDSRFESNSNYSGVSSVDPGETIFGNIYVEGSVFEDNEFAFGSVWGYADITVLTSTFLNNVGYNASAIEKWSADLTWETADLTVIGNYFSGNYAESESTIYADSASATIVNNTFDGNDSGSDWAGADIALDEDSSSLVAFNTFAGSTSETNIGSVTVRAGADLGLYANLFAPGEGIVAALGVDEMASVTDHGGNVSTGADAPYLIDATSQSLVSVDDIQLEDAADNGGPTWTMALGEGSVAIDVAEIAIADELGLDAVDQRAGERGELTNAGAWDGEPGTDDPDDSDLAATGIDASVIAFGGAALAAAGVAIASRRRERR